MICDEIRAQLDAYVEGELSAPERAVITAHLATCDNCRVRVDASAQMTSLLCQIPREPAPGDLSARIRAAVEAERPVPRAQMAWVVLVAAGSLVAGLVAAWLAFETALAVQAQGAIDFLALLISRPEMLVAYPQDAVYALVETIPVAELLLTLGMALVTLLLLRQVLASLDHGRLPSV